MRRMTISFLMAAKLADPLDSCQVPEVCSEHALTGEPVFAILESNSYLLCTPNRGVLGGTPVLAGRPYRVIDFDD